MIRRFLLALLFVACGMSAAGAQTYMYSATCSDSYSKQGEQDVDLTKLSGKALRCDGVVLGFLKNGNILVQFLEKSSRVTPLGFAGSRLDYEMNPNFATLPLQRVYLPHTSDPAKPQVVSGVEGFCFLEGKINVRALSGISCTSKIEIGTQKLVYRVNAKITGLGDAVPGG